VRFEHATALSAHLHFGVGNGILRRMPPTTTSALRILLVDDDPLVCDSIRRMLEFDQRRVEVATSAKDALALCEKEKFDLIILDYVMPVMKGDKLAAMLKERFPQLPIIMITAAAEKLESPEQKPAGVDVMVAKPFRLDELREAVSGMLPRA
jgi:CheY-like chemotaxis protein